MHAAERGNRTLQFTSMNGMVLPVSLFQQVCQLKVTEKEKGKDSKITYLHKSSY